METVIRRSTRTTKRVALGVLQAVALMVLLPAWLAGSRIQDLAPTPAIAGALQAAAHIAPAQQQPATVVMIVRHAERAPGSGDPPISDAGRTRAAALAEIGRMAGVSAIITTQLQRTRQTAEPLAAALGMTIVTVPTGADLSTHVSDVAAAVRQQAGKTVLVVGHSNTVPLIVAALGGPRVPDLCEREYDALFTVVIDEGRSVRTVRSRFGAPTPVDATCAGMRP